ncbi:hypothetical protein BCR42DRAFT_176645 [Absidia repens]|uniref:Uncharacterized protein n=1 Tax=Absidia repens TaxID=90262 RepID=A0A1X2HZ38_9FUNG|nr:hypothetical protein BCR42DRAFT_176645 [Absidia repens]
MRFLTVLFGLLALLLATVYAGGFFYMWEGVVLCVVTVVKTGGERMLKLCRKRMDFEYHMHVCIYELMVVAISTTIHTLSYE